LGSVPIVVENLISFSGLLIIGFGSLCRKYRTSLIMNEGFGAFAFGIVHRLGIQGLSVLLAFGGLGLLLWSTLLGNLGSAGVGAASNRVLTLLLLRTWLGWGLGRSATGGLVVIVVLLLDLVEASLRGGTIAVAGLLGNVVPVDLQWNK
jgi:hypothetical protein